MKNKFLALLLGFVMIISLGFIFTGETFAKPCPVSSHCTNCAKLKHDCCKNCKKDCKDCKKNCDCKNCKNCYHKVVVKAKTDCNNCKKPINKTQKQ